MASLAHLRSPAVQQRQQRPCLGTRGASASHPRSSTPPTPTIAAAPLSRRRSSSSARPRRHSVAARATPAPKPMPAWDGIYAYITKRNLETVSPREAFDLASKKGWVVVDVRPRKRHEAAAPDIDGGRGVVSVPLYDTPDFSKPSLARYLRAAMLASQGVAPVEQNEEFVPKILELLEKKKGLLFLCEVGGSLEPTVSFPTGKTSRSLQAAFRALEAGVEQGRVKHVGGGCYAWAQGEEGGLPMTGEYDASGVGRTPGVVRQQQKRRSAALPFSRWLKQASSLRRASFSGAPESPQLKNSTESSNEALPPGAEAGGCREGDDAKGDGKHTSSSSLQRHCLSDGVFLVVEEAKDDDGLTLSSPSPLVYLPAGSSCASVVVGSIHNLEEVLERVIAGAGAAATSGGEDEGLSSTSPPSPLATAAAAASPRSAFSLRSAASSSTAAAAPLPPISWADWAARVSSGRGATLAAEVILRAAVKRGLGGGGSGGGSGSESALPRSPSLSSSSSSSRSYSYPRSSSFSSSSSSLSAASRDLLCELSGSFALALYDGATGRFLAAVDPAASRKLWLAPLENGGVALTNDPRRAAELAAAEEVEKAAAAASPSSSSSSPSPAAAAAPDAFCGISAATVWSPLPAGHFVVGKAPSSSSGSSSSSLPRLQQYALSREQLASRRRSDDEGSALAAAATPTTTTTGSTDFDDDGDEDEQEEGERAFASKAFAAGGGALGRCSAELLGSSLDESSDDLFLGRQKQQQQQQQRSAAAPAFFSASKLAALLPGSRRGGGSRRRSKKGRRVAGAGDEENRASPSAADTANAAAASAAAAAAVAATAAGGQRALRIFTGKEQQQQ